VRLAHARRAGEYDHLGFPDELEPRQRLDIGALRLTSVRLGDNPVDCSTSVQNIPAPCLRQVRWDSHPNSTAPQPSAKGDPER
jgi:hypothetical protein